MKIRAHEAEVLVVGTRTDGRRDHPDHTAGLHGRGAEQASGRGAKKTLCRGSGPARHHNTPQVSMVLATVLSASREAVRSHRTSTHDGQVAVDLLAPRSRRRYHVVSCARSEGLHRGVQERYKQDYTSRMAVRSR